MRGHIKFNVIIPTRERADTLHYCLKTVVAQDYDNLNIIVSDNLSQDDTEEVVRSFSDERIKYVKTASRVSMSHNWEFALSHVDQGYVTFIGDDDALLPGAIQQLADILKDYPFDAVTSPYCIYNWPENGLTDRPTLMIPLSEGVAIKDSKEMLKKVMRGCATYPELPWLYTGGFASIDIINKSRNAQGFFFLSLNPDIYSSVALSCSVDSYLYIKTPLAVAGLSRHSHGSSNLNNSKYSQPQKQFQSENNIPFHSSLIFGSGKSIPLFVYESYLQASHLHNNELNINIENQLRTALAFSSRNKTLINNDCKKIARINRIPFKQVKKGIWPLWLWLAAREAIKRLWGWRDRLTINTSLFNAQTVYDASILAYTVNVFHRRYRNHKIKRFVQSLPYFGRIYREMG